MIHDYEQKQIKNCPKWCLPHDYNNKKFQNGTWFTISDKVVQNTILEIKVMIYCCRIYTSGYKF